MNAVELSSITKRFAGVVANDDVYFSAARGEVHALLGENGAGKSTLMSILAGLYHPDTGTIKINGEQVRFHSPGDAIAHGVGMVYQHFMLVGSLTVAENCMLGQREAGSRLRLDTTRTEREIAALSERYGLQVHPRARIWQLSVGEQQRVEILRLLHRGAQILVFDEPTAVLTPQESEGLVSTLRNMAEQGFCIIFISHKLDEVLAVADRITVMRKGRVIATVDAAETDKHTLARLMVGREVFLDIERQTAQTGETVLELRELSAKGDRALPALQGVDLAVRSGEILGIAGVAGNGQRELAEVVAGMRPSTGGQLLVGGKDVTGCSPRDMVEAGVAHIPEDRTGTGLITGLDLADNLILKDYREPPLARGPFLDGQAAGKFADRLLNDYNVVGAQGWQKAALLSGGNQQKLLLARELSGKPRLIVAVHPTRGVDIGATEAIRKLLLDQRARGAAILLISEDLDELLALSDRVAVLYEGRIMGTVDAAGADIDHLGMMMAGTKAPAPEKVQVPEAS